MCAQNRQQITTTTTKFTIVVIIGWHSAQIKLHTLHAQCTDTQNTHTGINQIYEAFFFLLPIDCNAQSFEHILRFAHIQYNCVAIFLSEEKNIVFCRV